MARRCYFILLDALFLCGLATLSIASGTSFKTSWPTAPGTSWEYSATDESGNDSPGGTPSTTLIRRMAGHEDFHGDSLLKLETFSGNVLSKTELLKMDKAGLHCLARSDREGLITALDPPELILPAKLKTGATWTSSGMVADMQMQQEWSVTGVEEVTVPAGKFQALHLHCAQSAPMSIAFDRWFVPGTGFIKELIVMRSPGGELLGRKSLELSKGLHVAPRQGGPEKGPLTVSVSSNAVGPLEKEFASSVPNIYARWEGNNLPHRARVRAVWIAEDVGDVAPKDYHIDQATTVASAPNAHGLFTLSRPEGGWAPGKYRVEFYVDDVHAQTVRLTIRPPAAP